MEKFKIEVIRTDTYEIEVNMDEVHEDIKSQYNTSRDLAESLALSVTKYGSDWGFMDVLVDTQNQFIIKCIIPKNAVYFYNERTKIYCSNYIKIGKITDFLYVKNI